MRVYGLHHNTGERLSFVHVPQHAVLGNTSAGIAVEVILRHALSLPGVLFVIESGTMQDSARELEPLCPRLSRPFGQGPEHQ